MISQSQSHLPRGFSLVELMASMAIGSIVLLSAAVVLESSGESYAHIRGDVETEREARFFMTQLTSDLSTATFHRDGVLEKSSAIWPVDRLGFLCLFSNQAQSPDGRVGDLCAVHYYIKDLSIGGKSVRCLMRGFRESRVAFRALADREVSALFEQQSDIDEPIVFGVVAFEARPKSRAESGLWEDWVKNDECGPEAIEVSLILVRRDLVSKLKLPSDWDGAGAIAKVLGSPGDISSNANLGRYATMMRFGSDENP